MATSKRLMSLTISNIQANINKATRLLEEVYYYKKPILGKKKAYTKRVIQNGYIQSVAQRANIKDGIPCMRCNKFIKPYSNCYVKYRHNHSISVPTYYHETCWEGLFHRL